MAARPLVPSQHAREAMARRAVSWGEVVSVVSRAEHFDRSGDRTRYFRGSLCVVVASDGTVVTVLLRSQSQWNDSDARHRRQGS